jgi:uncharacterized membrane protein
MATATSAASEPRIVSVVPTGEVPAAASTHNVGTAERIGSALSGGVLAAFGISRGGIGGLTMALVGGSLLHRGVTGNCMGYSALGINTARPNDGRPVRIGAGRGVKITQSITILKEPAELFTFWRNFRNLPRVMRHLQAVEVISDSQSHWVASAPFGKTVEWDAEIYTERTNELIGWRSLAGSQVDTAGSVQFRNAPGARGTEVTVTLKYDPPAGKLGAAIAAMFGESADHQVKEDLRRFKQIMEAGEAPTNEGQPRGMCV